MSILCIAACLLLVPARSQAQVSVRALVEQMADQDSSKVYDAYRQLRTRRPELVSRLLVKRIPSLPRYGQGLAVSVLRSLPLDVARPAFRRLTRSSVPVVKLSAAVALHDWGESGMERIVVRVLRNALDADAALRDQLVRKLSWMDTPAVREAVRAYVREGVQERVLATVLWYFTGNEDGEVARRARELCDSGTLEGAPRRIAEAFLLTRGDTKAEAYFTSGILERATSRELAHIRDFLQKASRLPTPVLDALTKLLETSEDSRSRKTLLQILGTHRHRKARPAMEKLLEGGDASVAKEAFDALSKLGGATNRDLLRRLLADEQSVLRLQAADALRRLDDDSGFSLVRELASKPGRDRLEALEVLSAFRSRSVVSVLLDALADEDERVRSRAFWGLPRVLMGLLPYRRIDLAKTGYAPTAPASQREKALAELRRWWEAK